MSATPNGPCQPKTYSRRSILKYAAMGTSALAGGPLLAACGHGAVSAAKSGGSSRSTGPIKVGVISPLTGAWTVYGKGQLDGFLVAVDEINSSGGTLGRKWQPIVLDSQTNPSIIPSLVQKLVVEDEVDFLAGTFSSASRNAAAPAATAHDKVLLYPTFYEGQEQKYYPGVCNPNIFMFGPTPTQQAWPFLPYIMHNHGNNFFLLGSDYVWPQVTNSVVKQKLTELGGKVVDEVYVPLDQTEFSSVTSRVLASGADVLFLTLTGVNTVDFRKQFYAQGGSKKLTIWTVDDEEAATSGVGPAASAGTYVSFDYFWFLKNSNNASFRRVVRAKYPTVLMDTVGVAMYNAAHMAHLAMTKTGEVSTTGLRHGLAGLTFNGAPQGYPVTMRAIDNQLVVPSYLVRTRPNWTGPDNMFELVQENGPVQPVTAACSSLPLN